MRVGLELINLLCHKCLFMQPSGQGQMGHQEKGNFFPHKLGLNGFLLDLILYKIWVVFFFLNCTPSKNGLHFPLRFMD